jgi:hypothetical protein
MFEAAWPLPRVLGDPSVLLNFQTLGRILSMDEQEPLQVAIAENGEPILDQSS